jgi:predicted O-linked N-acetylglucosamine transferase (SPINDLY family)
MNREERRVAAELGSAVTQWLGAGLQHHQAGRLVEAEACYRQVLAAQPNHVAAHFSLGNALAGQGKLDEAVAAFRQAIRINPDYAEAYSDLGIALAGQGKLDEAVAAHRQAIRVNPDYALAYSNLGSVLMDQGKLDEAVAALRRAIHIKPDYADAHSNLGNALRAEGKLDEAVAALRQAIRIDPDYAEAYSILGIALAGQGKLDEAVAAFRQAIRIKPDLVEPHSNLGNVLRAQGKLDEAVAAHRQAIRVNPDYALAYSNLGTVLMDQGKLDEAVAALRRAIHIKPDYAEAYSNLGSALGAGAKFDEAVAAYRQAIRIKPNYAEAHANLGSALASQGKLDEAVAAFRQAIRIKPDLVEPHSYLGSALRAQGKLDEAVAAYRQAIRIKPNYAEAHANLGRALTRQGKLDEAVAALRRAIHIKPDHADAYSNLGSALNRQGKLDEAIAAYREAIRIKPDYAEAFSNLLFCLQHKPGVTKAEVLREHKRWAELYRPSAAKDRFGFPNEPDPDRLPRLGLVSADLRRHAVAFLTLRAYEALTSLGYELFCYQTDQNRVADDFTDRFKAISTWRDASRIDDDALAKQIAEDRIDILFDLAGHTTDRLPVFAQRAAPIQLSWAGYVGTIGLDTYDGLIADPVEVPPEDDQYYVEPVIRLPDCYVCYEAPIDAAVAPLPSLGGARFTFGCFNRPAKINEEVAKAWARILERVPDSRILMVYDGLDETGTRQALHGVFGRGGVPLDRVELIGHGEQGKLFAAYGDVDIALDPFPYSGGVTTLEAMWMGVPTITYVGDTFAGRHSATHLTAAGLREFLTSDVDSYVAAAVSWSSRREELAELRRGLRARVDASPLRDAPRFARNLSDQLMRLWIDWCKERRARA